MAVTQKASIDDALASLVRGAHQDPFAILGPHADEGGATVVRVFQPAARSIALVLVATGTVVPMERRGPAGIFEVRLKPDTTGEETTEEKTTADSALGGCSGSVRL